MPKRGLSRLGCSDFRMTLSWGEKNLAGAPFNIVTHAYDGTAAGQKLRHHDDMVKFRGELRTMNLAARNHLGFNPIIGEQVYPIRIPERPHAASMPALAH
mmetsp:Transcript_90592/g.242650  ORF Transcript_90592/g.242650 Transcript_90592/m.242650 type:complete len:100 (+) Transcript_90592:351-650(+)